MQFGPDFAVGVTGGDQEGDEAEVYLRDGQVYAVSVPGRRTMLGVRLMSSGALSPLALITVFPGTRITSIMTPSFY